jgi:hypothetical protein
VFYNLCFIVFYLVYWLIYWMVNIPLYQKGKMYFSMCAKYIFNLYVPQKYFSVQQKQVAIVPMHKICNNISVKDYKLMSLSKFFACYAWPWVKFRLIPIILLKEFLIPATLFKHSLVFLKVCPCALTLQYIFISDPCNAIKYFKYLSLVRISKFCKL